MFDNFGPNIARVLEKYWGLFLQGAGYTLLLSFITVFFGTILGSALALMRRSRFKPANALATGYVELMRGTPLLLQLYFFYFMLPELLPLLNLSKFACVSIALVFNSAAYVCEIVRAGIQAVDPGQTEAARTLGLSARQAMTRIVLPQAVKNILPALGNEFVTVIKETSLASTFFVGDLMTQYSTVRGTMFLVLEPLVVVGVIYFLLTFFLSKLVNSLERRMKASD
ncbi:MAG: amino acid ABC transporter permease [Clostridiales bacterium]|nr:amino acid ABC transporter permease [Clostridiales bacterium]